MIIFCLQVTSLQERLTQLQCTMLDVMDKYDNLRKLEELHLKNLGMGSLLILIPFCPELKKLTLKYSLRLVLIISIFSLWLHGNPGLTKQRQTSAIPCSGESLKRTGLAVWRWWRSGSRVSVSSPPSGLSGTVLSSSSSSLCLPGRNNICFSTSKFLSRNTNEEEQVALWREGRRREPNPVEIDF